MKKLLSVIMAFGLTISSTDIVISCSNHSSIDMVVKYDGYIKSNYVYKFNDKQSKILDKYNNLVIKETDNENIISLKDNKILKNDDGNFLFIFNVNKTGDSKLSVYQNNSDNSVIDISINVIKVSNLNTLVNNNNNSCDLKIKFDSNIIDDINKTINNTIYNYLLNINDQNIINSWNNNEIKITYPDSFNDNVFSVILSASDDSSLIVGSLKIDFHVV